MCGYTGIVWKDGCTPGNAAAVLEGIEPILYHRGPDDRGLSTGKGFAVLHRRLSIIDAAHGNQPMVMDNGLVGLAYNGEIYNFREIRRELEQKGHSFRTDCDTEVLLKVYAEEGEECFTRLDGMFTAFIWDFRDNGNGKYYLVRDHLGIKPLYLYEDASKLIFSSELKPILALSEINLSPDPVGLASYFTYRYVQAPNTLFNEIRRIEAGTFIRIQNARTTTWRYWDIPTNESVINTTDGEVAEEFRYLLQKSVAQQQMSDVPVGLLLSGGLDSSAIAGLCSSIGVSMMSFNIGFRDLNEFVYSEDVARKFNLPHTMIETSLEEIISRFSNTVSEMDEPIADPACFPLSVLCEHIKKEVTVVLSGEGSDEMLGGYPQYRNVLGTPPCPQNEKFRQFLNFSWYFSDPPPLRVDVPASRMHRQKIYFDERSVLNGMLAYDLKTWLPENLMAKADKILMSHSLEGRFPFLNRRIVEYCASLPEDLKIGNSGGKILLTRAFAKILPGSVLNRPKMGFSVPVGELVLHLREKLYDMLESSRSGALTSLLDVPRLKLDIERHYSGKEDRPLFAWTLMVLLQWQESMKL